MALPAMKKKTAVRSRRRAGTVSSTAVIRRAASNIAGRPPPKKEIFAQRGGLIPGERVVKVAGWWAGSIFTPNFLHRPRNPANGKRGLSLSGGGLYPASGTQK